jgi:ribonuclease BN (tRNA processing enzyme)
LEPSAPTSTSTSASASASASASSVSIPTSLQFLGTAGARYVVATQRRHSGGLVWRRGKFTLWVDPGPGALVRALSAKPVVNPLDVNAVLVSHRHLDHAGDTTAVVEALSEGGSNPRGWLLAPADAYEPEPMLYSYARPFLERIITISTGLSVPLSDGWSVRFPIEHRHGVQTYGYRLESQGWSAAHVVDTVWFPDLIEAYSGVDVLIVNTTTQKARQGPLHLGFDDAERLIAAVKPGLALLTHFGRGMLDLGPGVLANELSQRTGVETRAAEDGMLLPDLTVHRKRS